MLKVPNLNTAYLKRTFKPLYANTQATPKSMFLDPAWDKSVDIYPGFGLVKGAGNTVSLPSVAAASVIGFAAFFEAPALGISELTDQGINACAVWVLGPDAEFQVDAPAFDSSLTYTDPATTERATLLSVYYSGAKRGQLAPLGTALTTTKPVARLLGVNSATSITIGGLDPNAYAN